MRADLQLVPANSALGFPVEGTTGEPACGAPCLPGEAQCAACAAAYAAPEGERDTLRDITDERLLDAATVADDEAGR
jgi:hypothetical protein